MHSGEIVRRTAKSLSPTQRAFQITSQMSDTSLLLRHLIPVAHGHDKRPSSFVTPYSSIKSYALTLQMLSIIPYSITSNCQRDHSAAERKLSEYADTRNRSTLFCAIGESPHHSSDHFSRSECPSWYLFKIRWFHRVVCTSNTRNWDTKYGVVSLHSVLKGHLQRDEDDKSLDTPKKLVCFR